MSEAMRFPVGKFSVPAVWNDQNVNEWRTDIGELPEKVRAAVSGLDNAQLDTPYRDGGWTVRQTVHHIADSHMNAYCRFRLALTEDKPTIKTYLEAKWAELSDARTLPVAPSLQIIDGVHTRWKALIDSFTDKEWALGFVHPDHGGTITLSQTAALYSWHSRHHVAHINNLRTRNKW